MKVYRVEDIEALKSLTLIDVRSEAEFYEAHIPGAINIPLLNNEERAEVGTLYKKEGSGPAQKKGLEIVEPKLQKLFEAIAMAACRGLENPVVQIPKSKHLSAALEFVQERIVGGPNWVIPVGVSRVRGGPLPRSWLSGHPVAPSWGVRASGPPDADTAEAAPVCPPQLVQPGVLSQQPIVFYCWRGGARSRSMALFAQALGFNAGVVEGGHRAFRRRVLQFLEVDPYPFKVRTLYGLTGCGKTKMLRQWLKEGKPVIDLEALAHHRGSAFGQVGIEELGRQKDFENNLYWEIQKLLRRGEREIIVEGESRRIGRCQLPLKFLEAMTSGTRVQVVAPLEVRVQNILEEYVNGRDEAALVAEAHAALDRLIKRLGGQAYKELLLLLSSRNFGEFTRRLLLDYYDKTYCSGRAEKRYDATIEV